MVNSDVNYCSSDKLHHMLIDEINKEDEILAKLIPQLALVKVGDAVKLDCNDQPIYL